jgi:hypothetical protein
LVNGKINGFSIGERVFSIRKTILTSEDKAKIKTLPQGIHLLAKKFSKGRYWFEIDKIWYSGRKSHFQTFIDGKVILKVW